MLSESSTTAPHQKATAPVTLQPDRPLARAIKSLVPSQAQNIKKKKKVSPLKIHLLSVSGEH